MENELFNDPEFRELIKSYLEYLVESVQKLKTNLADLDKLRKFGHDLKGTGSGYGYDDFTRLGGILEKAAIENKPAEVQKIFEEFESLLSKEQARFKVSID